VAGHFGIEVAVEFLAAEEGAEAVEQFPHVICHLAMLPSVSEAMMLAASMVTPMKIAAYRVENKA